MSFTRIDANNISPSGVAAGTYTNPTITINSSGQVTSASSGQLAQGLQGVQGIIGLQGLQGLGGVQGSSGYIGQDGVQGIQGTQGSGVQGIQGTQGSGAGLAVAQYTTYVHTGDGTTTSFSATSGLTVDTVLVVVDGVTQTPTTNYTISGSSVVFAAAPPNGSVIQLRALGGLIGPQGIAGTGGGLTISSITVTDSSYADLDDTAVSVSGGYIKITGTGFASGCQVVVGTVVAASVSFVSSTEVRAQVPAQVAGTYTVYLTNPNGGVAIRVNGVNYSSTPTWTTTSPLPGGVKNTEISLQLAATSNSSVTYSLANGSTLPSGLTLSSGGLLSGTVTSISADTTYNFTVVATDAEAQDTPQAFQITIIIGDPYYELVALHLPGTGTNLANNNTFQDSSSNNFTITRSGNTTQGTFSPFSQTGWGNYFDGASNSTYLRVTDALNFAPTGAFTAEMWLYITSTSSYNIALATGSVSAAYAGLRIDASNQDQGNNFTVFLSTTGSSWAYVLTGGAAITKNQWNHVAVTRDSSNNVRVFINGAQVNTTTTVSGTLYNSGANNLIGAGGTGSTNGYNYAGYISNLRLVSGTAVYTSAFTPPTSPLTAISGTSLLTCQSNRFIDNSTNNFTITKNGDTRVVAFSPFNPTSSWSATTNGGSGYFDGSGDSLTTSSQAALGFGTGDFSVEFWAYRNAGLSNYTEFFKINEYNTGLFFRTESPQYNDNFYFVGSGYHYDPATNFIPLSWNHFVVTRTSGALRLFINGKLIISSTNTGNMGAGTLNLGVSGYAGYLSGIRVLKGSVAPEYQTSSTTVGAIIFAPPTSPPTTITNTSLLLNFTNAGIYDAAGKNDLETVGNAQISTAIAAKWGSGSMAFDGAGSPPDYLPVITPVSDFYAFGTGDFTFELWLYTTTVSPAYQAVWDARTADPSLGSHFVLNSGKPTWWLNGASRIQAASALSVNTWYHIAVARNGTSTKMFVDGTQVGSTYTDSNAYISRAVPRIGASFDTTPINPFAGYLQDLRITKGYARYTANFTAPTAAFPTL